MSTAIEADVAIVGGGPVGLTLAMDLADRGIEVVVLESREPRAVPSVKCNHVAARSMEIYRRLGVAASLRDAGLPPDHAHDIAFRTRMTAPDFGRIRIPSRRTRFTDLQAADGNWPTPEPPHRINQIYMEPILFDHAAARARVSILNRTQAGAVVQTDSGVVVTATDAAGRSQVVQARFAVGCDGGRSGVRAGIGATLVGDPVVQRVQSTFIRAPGLTQRLRGAPAWGTLCLNPERSGTLYAVDGLETWLVHNYLRPDEKDFDAVDRAHSIRAILGVDESLDYAVISHQDWIGRRLLADRFRDRRIFLCGDAAHIWVPYAGYGMNAGIADAANLAWLLAAHLNGWAPEPILAAYERERRPITEQVSRFAMAHAEKMIANRRAVPADIEAPGPAGDAVRAAYGQEMEALNVAQYACAGLNFGYFYDDSPIIVYDGAQPPAYSMDSYQPSTVPGCRLPHRWLDGGRSLYDLLGADYTLLIPAAAPAPGGLASLTDAARACRLPLAVLAVPPAPETVAADRYLLVRPDQHLAWRGRALPADPTALLDRIRGR